MYIYEHIVSTSMVCALGSCKHHFIEPFEYLLTWRYGGSGWHGLPIVVIFLTRSPSSWRYQHQRVLFHTHTHIYCVNFPSTIKLLVLSALGNNYWWHNIPKRSVIYFIPQVPMHVIEQPCLLFVYVQVRYVSLHYPFSDMVIYLTVTTQSYISDWITYQL